MANPEAQRVDHPRVIVHAMIAGLICAISISMLSSTFSVDLLDPFLWDAYFGSDLPRNLDDLLSPAVTYRFGASPRHPLVRLLFFPLGSLLHHGLGLAPVAIFRALLTTNAFLWGGLLFLLCRHVTRRSLDAFVLTALALSSAASMFWLATPETFAFGSTTILAAMFVLACTRVGESSVAHVLLQLATLSITVTNWMAGVMAGLSRIGVARTVRATMLTAALAAALFTLQAAVIPRAGPLANPIDYLRRGGTAKTWSSDSNFVNRLPLHVTLDRFFLTPLSPLRFEHCILPLGDPWPPADFPSLTLPPCETAPVEIVNPPLFAGRLKAIPWLAWSVLLAAGLIGATGAFTRSPLARVMLLFVAGQLALHLVYGHEIFLYSVHWQPVLVIVTGYALASRWRMVALSIAALLAVHNGVVNVAMFLDAARIAQGFGAYIPR